MAIDARNYDPALMAGAGMTVAGATTFGSTVDVSTVDALEVADVIPANRLFVIWRLAPATGAATSDATMFISPGNYTVTSISCIYSAAQGGTATVSVTKDTGTTAPGAGTSIMSGTFNLNTTVNTGQSATLSGTPTLTAGDRLGLDFSTTIGSLADLVIQVNLKRSA